MCNKNYIIIIYYIILYIIFNIILTITYIFLYNK